MWLCRDSLASSWKAIKVELRAELLEGDDAEVEASANRTVTVPMDGQTIVKFSLKSGETPLDRAWLEVKLLNFREMA
jgi:hypothetical protein